MSPASSLGRARVSRRVVSGPCGQGTEGPGPDMAVAASNRVNAIKDQSSIAFRLASITNYDNLSQLGPGFSGGDPQKQIRESRIRRSPVSSLYATGCRRDCIDSPPAAPSRIPRRRFNRAHSWGIACWVRARGRRPRPALSALQAGARLSSPAERCHSGATASAWAFHFWPRATWRRSTPSTGSCTGSSASPRRTGSGCGRTMSRSPS